MHMHVLCGRSRRRSRRVRRHVHGTGSAVNLNLELEKIFGTLGSSLSGTCMLAYASIMMDSHMWDGRMGLGIDRDVSMRM